MRIIEIKCCGDCPFNRHDNGGGFVEPFNICDKYGIILIDDEHWTNVASEIHECCKLPHKES
jgi:hypothetical protein